MREKLWTSDFLSMSGSNFLMFITHYILTAALPIYIIDALDGDSGQAGLAMTFFQIGTVSARPLAGRIIDSMNKRRLMLVVTVVFFLLMLALCFWHSLTGLCVIRLLHGIVFAVGTTAAAAMAAMVLPLSRKGEGIGYFALSVNLAMVVGPMLGLLLIGRLGAEALFFFLAADAALILWTANHRRLPDAVILPAKKEHSGWHVSDFIEKRALAMAGLGGLVFFAYGGVLTLIPLYARELGLMEETSLFFALFAAVIILTRPVIGRIFDRKGPDYTVYPGFAAFGLGMLLLGHSGTLSGFMCSAALLGLGFGALSPAFQTMAVQSALSSRSGVSTATYFWALDISVGLAAVFLSMASQRWGFSFMYGTICTAVIVLTCLCYMLWSRIRSAKSVSCAVVRDEG